MCTRNSWSRYLFTPYVFVSHFKSEFETSPSPSISGLWVSPQNYKPGLACPKITVELHFQDSRRRTARLYYKDFANRLYVYACSYF